MDTLLSSTPAEHKIFTARLSRALALISMLALWTAGCSDGSLNPDSDNNTQIGSGSSTTGSTTGNANLGLVAITIRGIGTHHMSTSAHSVPPRPLFRGAAAGFTPPDRSNGGGDGTIELTQSLTAALPTGRAATAAYATCMLRSRCAMPRLTAPPMIHPAKT